MPLCLSRCLWCLRERRRSRLRGATKVNLVGWSQGGPRSAGWAAQHPERVNRLVLSAFTYKGHGAAEIARRTAVADRYRNSPRRTRDRDKPLRKAISI